MPQSRDIFRKVSKRLLPDQKAFRTFFKEILQSDNQNRTSNSAPDLQRKTSSKPKNEAYYRDKLARKLRGKTEVRTPAGDRIDILTSSEIIEVKQVKAWKSALGQIMIYGDSYPSHQKRIHLFGDKSSVNFRHVENSCKRRNVVVSWEEDE
jgi:hypothetical protein